MQYVDCSIHFIKHNDRNLQTLAFRRANENKLKENWKKHIHILFDGLIHIHASIAIHVVFVVYAVRATLTVWVRVWLLFLLNTNIHTYTFYLLLACIHEVLPVCVNVCVADILMAYSQFSALAVGMDSYIYTHTRTHMPKYLMNIHTCLCLHTFLWMYVYTYIYVCLFIKFSNVYICMYACFFCFRSILAGIFFYTYTFFFLSTNTYIHSY